MKMKKENIKKEDMILNHGLLITVFTVIYFIYKYYTEKVDPYAIILDSLKIIYLYCGAMHIIFSIGLLFGKHIDILINKLKKYTKLKMKIEKNK